MTNFEVFKPPRRPAATKYWLNPLDKLDIYQAVSKSQATVTLRNGQEASIEYDTASIRVKVTAINCWPAPFAFIDPKVFLNLYEAIMWMEQ